MEASVGNQTAALATSAASSDDTQEMKAIVFDKYGPLSGLELKDIARPKLTADEVLVRVEAAALHIGDCFTVRGAPFAMRMVSGMFKPKYGVPGYDVAGRVEAVGDKVTRFQVGDQVFGTCIGSCAQFVSAKASELAHKPDGLEFTEAAAIPTSALAALHALRDVGELQPGQKVLINGASGGVGTFAVQIAKAFGAEVTGVCSGRNAELVRSLGADHVIDYTKDNFTRGEARYDLIFDNIENRSLAECRRALTPRGMLILNSGTGATGLRMFVRLIKPLVVSPFVRHRLRRYLSKPKHTDLVVLKEMVESETLRPVIDKRYPLAETAAALEYIETGHVSGKVVVSGM